MWILFCQILANSGCYLFTVNCINCSARKGSDLVYKTVLGMEKQSCVSYAVLCEQKEKHLCDLEKTCVEENCLQMCKGMEEGRRDVQE
ncbi:hypothetical protein E3N88_33662 [Mikania micrantha]|uniref:VDE lipocalin domain-containing protein n=1 Tax=Mikania micrantha TaxID=192012 RepID=A0A5N6MD91_9ASTR|nr:hypothetical protein E3N88_33662 [Mikania micrantha]